MIFIKINKNLLLSFFTLKDDHKPKKMLKINDISHYLNNIYIMIV